MEGVGGSVEVQMAVQVGVRVRVRGAGETAMEGNGDQMRVMAGGRVGDGSCMLPSTRESEKTPSIKPMETRAMMNPQKTCRTACILFRFFRLKQYRQQDTESGPAA